MPRMSTPPVAVSSSIMRSVRWPPSPAPARVSAPCTTATTRPRTPRRCPCWRRGDGHDAVEGALDHEQLGVAPDAVDRAEDGQRPDAEGQAGGDEPLDEGAARGPGGGAVLARLGQPFLVRSASPTSPPRATETMGNTALRVSRNESTPTASTTSPMPLSTVVRVRSGNRASSARPTAVPPTTLRTLTTVEPAHRRTVGPARP